MIDATITFDFGGSGCRAIAQVPGQPEQLYLLSPEMAQIERGRIEDTFAMLHEFGEPNLTTSIWLEFAGSAYVLGDFAKQFAVSGLQLSKQKFELGITKALALIAWIAQDNGLEKGASIALGVVLPWREYKDRRAFEDQLCLQVQNYIFRGQSVGYQLDLFTCYPEGWGVLNNMMFSEGLNNAAVWMWGFRDTTVLWAANRQREGSTEPWGFRRFIERFQERARLPICDAQEVEIDELYLARVLGSVTSLEPEQLRSHLSPLVSGLSVLYQEDALTQLCEQYERIYQLYFQDAISVFERNTPQHIERIIPCGGTAWLYRSLLNEYLKQKPGVQQSWATQQERAVMDTFGKKVVKAEGLQYRLDDPMGIFGLVRAQVKHRQPSAGGLKVAR
ncbi:acetate and sugar kinases/Hsc70/actin family protein [Acaryochloris marina]|nr:hypothetical protein [Acaryochloris marina]BDM83190.1 hypothetical protein AM10699_60510 [Acaryochloris marina MBIC10699]